MKMSEMQYRIGYVDEETAFSMTFKRKMRDDFEVVLFDLNEETILDSLIQEIEDAELDCLIVDFDLKETELITFFGDKVIERMQERYPHLPYFIITSKDEADVLSHVEDNELVRLKDELNDKPDILKQRIFNKIENYHSRIKAAKSSIQQLVDLKKSDGLNPEQEDELYKNYQFLDQVYPDERLLPDSLKNKESVTQLSDFVQSTRSILEELKRINN